MSIDRFLTTAITIVTPGTAATRYGDAVPDWDSPAASVDTFGWLTEAGTTEEIGLRDAVVSRWRLFVAAGTTIGAADRVLVGDDVYEVEGQPHSAGTPGGEHHVEVGLRRVVG